MALSETKWLERKKMKLYFGGGKSYLQGYVNIVPKELETDGYFSDLTVSLEEFSLPQGYLDELLFDARLFKCKSKLFWIGWFLGVKSWLWRWTSCVEIQNIPLQSCQNVIELFKRIGLDEIGSRRMLHNKTLKLTFSSKTTCWDDVFAGLNDMQKRVVLHVYSKSKGKKGAFLQAETVGKEIDAGTEKGEILIIRPLGGLGSQLSLYALGRKISYFSNLELKIDVSFFENTWPGTTERSYRLHHFNIISEYATPKDIGKVIDVDQCLGPWNYEYSYCSRPLIHLHHGFDKQIFHVRSNTMIIGDGIDFSYFDDIKCILKKDLLVKTSPSLLNAQIIAELMKKENTVSVHVRLTDYMPRDHESKEIWLKDKLTFYYNAVQYLEKISPTMEYYVFSDDFEMLNGFLPFIFQRISKNRVRVVQHNREAEDYEDFRLMTLCRFHITIGSIYSIWAAYLSPNIQGMILPKNSEPSGIEKLLPVKVI